MTGHSFTNPLNRREIIVKPRVEASETRLQKSESLSDRMAERIIFSCHKFVNRDHGQSVYHEGLNGVNRLAINGEKYG